MDKPYLRHPNFVQELPWRRWLRNGLEGLPFPQQPVNINVQDIDLVTTLYGDCIGRDLYADGIIRLFEIKQMTGKMSYGQMRLFSMMDRMLRAGDPEGKNYGGFYFLHWEPPDRCKLNGRRMTMDELAQFMLGQLEVEPVTPEEAYEKRRQRLF